LILDNSTTDDTSRTTIQRHIDEGTMIIYIPDYEVIICVECGHALNGPPGVSKHLKTMHGWPRVEAKAMDKQFVDITLIRSPSDPSTTWIIPKPEDRPVPYLPVHKKGFGCHLCQYVCRGKKTMYNHYSNHHRDEFDGFANKLWREEVQLQAFAIAGPNKQFFEVNRGSNASSTNGAPSINNSIIRTTPSGDLEQDVATVLRRELHAQIKQRLNMVQNSMATIQKSQDPREINPWLERTRWIDHLQGQDLRQIAKLTLPPRRSEKVLSMICGAFKVLIHNTKKLIVDRDQNVTFSHFDMRQINSFNRDVTLAKRPMVVQIQDATLNSYIGVWQRLLCYVIRTSLPDAVPEDYPPLLYRLTDDQREALTGLLCTAKQLISIPTFDVAYKHIANSLEITCVNASIKILDHILHGNEYDNVLVSFLAVNGIDSDKGVFKDVQICTRDLSALIKIAQFLVIKQSAYEMEAGRADYVDVPMEEMRLRFMTRDGRTPMGWMLGLRAYGRKLTEKRTVDGNIVWSEDYQRISYKTFECTLTNFRRFVSALTAKARNQLADLFLVQSGENMANVAPAVRLYAIKDVPRESRAGWSFLMDPRNEHLFDGSTWMVDRILNNPRLLDKFFIRKSTKPTWRPKAMIDYLNAISSFLETLWILVHITSGQPARVTEWLSIRHCNTLQGEHRNVFVEEGLISIVTSYHKGYNMEGSTKVIHRYLPKDISEIMVLYLWLILPFKEHLESTRTTSKAAPSPSIWGNGKGSATRRKWDSGRVCEALERESSEILKSKLQIRTYRHVAIAMARKHIRGTHFTPVLPEEDETWDFQCAHGANVGGAIYARELNDAPGVIESQREAFRRISLMWHLFLGFETWKMSSKRPCPFGANEEGESSEEEGLQPVRRRKRVIRWIGEDDDSE